jgi:predicted transcriptional regulator
MHNQLSVNGPRTQNRRLYKYELAITFELKNLQTRQDLIMYVLQLPTDKRCLVNLPCGYCATEEIRGVSHFSDNSSICMCFGIPGK